MSAISVPDHIGAFQEQDSTPGRALTFVTNLRAVCVGVKNAQGWASDNAAPDWQGVAGASHQHTVTVFAHRLDAPEAALERAVTAADLFQRRMARLHLRRPLVEQARMALNEDSAALAGRLNAGVDGPQLAELRQQALALHQRAEVVIRAIRKWTSDYTSAEAEFVAALQTVDTRPEGRSAATDENRPDVARLSRRLLRELADPVALAAWWRTLNRWQRQALITEHPRLVGNAGGVPSSDRDAANRAALYRDLDYLQRRADDGQATPEELDRLENASYIREQIDAYRNQVDPDSGRELLHLLVFKPGEHSGDGGVAVSFGDPDRADHVSLNVPGLTSDASSTDGNLDKTMALHEATVAVDNGTVASVHWLDYDAPSGNLLNPLDPLGYLDFAGVAFDAKAAAGGASLADFISGLHASDRGEPAHVTAIGHSYGSTAVGHALQDGLAVGDAVLVGSPGVPEPTAAQLTAADVWVGSRDRDPVTLLGHGLRGGIGALGHDPAQAVFGGTRFATGDGSLRLQDLIANHKDYFQGTSLTNMAHIVGDRDALVTEQPPRGAPGGGYLTADELVAAAAATSAGSWLYDSGVELAESVAGFGDALLDPFRRPW